MTKLHLLEIILGMYFLKTFQKYLCKCYITVMSVLYSWIFFIFQLGKYHIKARFLRYLVEKNAEYVFPPNFYMIHFFNINNIDVSSSVLFHYESVRLSLLSLFLYFSNLLLPQNEALRLQTESYRTWRACLSYGLADDLFTYASW